MKPEAGANPLDRMYRAVEALDAEAVREALLPDAFLFTPESTGVLKSAAEVVADIRSRFDSVRTRDASLRIDVDSSLVGTSESGEACWVFDQVVVEVVREGAARHVMPVRVTALLTRDEGQWRLAAGYWSLPFETQEAQDSEKHASQLLPGALLEERIAEAARPLVGRLSPQ